MNITLPRILMCEHPLERGRVDPDFEVEARAAEACGFPVDLLSYEALVLAGDARRAVAQVRPGQFRDPSLAVYRGWMLRAEAYRRLYDALTERGLRLVNAPDEYRGAHEFPEYYAAIRTQTAASVWLPIPPVPTTAEILQTVRPFGRKPLVLRDYVKSRKHEWIEACFIPDAGDAAAVERVVRCFLERQGEDLYGGLVLREFLDLVPVGSHPQSGTPRFAEFRFFFLEGRALFIQPYWEGAPQPVPAPDPNLFAAAVRAVRSRFFSLDVAQRTDGGWAVIEVGDGQVSGLPAAEDAAPFYSALAQHMGP